MQIANALDCTVDRGIRARSANARRADRKAPRHGHRAVNYFALPAALLRRKTTRAPRICAMCRANAAKTRYSAYVRAFASLNSSSPITSMRMPFRSVAKAGPDAGVSTFARQTLGLTAVVVSADESRFEQKGTLSE